METSRLLVGNKNILFATFVGKGKCSCTVVIIWFLNHHVFQGTL